MTDLLICPNDEELRRLALAESDAAEIASFAEHLEHCPLCSERLENLPAFLALLPEIRRGAQSEPEYSLQEVEELRRTFGDRSTVVGGRAQKSALAGTSPSTDISLAGFLAPPEKPDELGRLGHYRVLRVLGAGGMGIVCEAEDLHLERRVALKVMKPALASDPSARRRFQREAKAAAAVEHDHIVPIFHVGEDREIPFLAMPLLKGESLEDRLKREKRLSVSEVCRVGQEIAEGLAVAHERGLIHRDIKPGNIWIESLLFTEGKGNGRVRILDFGLARICGDETPLTYTGAVIGSPGYMAPEGRRPTCGCADGFVQPGLSALSRRDGAARVPGSRCGLGPLRGRNQGSAASKPAEPGAEPGRFRSHHAVAQQGIIRAAKLGPGSCRANPDD
jgi:hypothetical protein